MDKLYSTRYLINICRDDEEMIRHLLEFFLDISVPATRGLPRAFAHNDLQTVT